MKFELCFRYALVPKINILTVDPFPLNVFRSDPHLHTSLSVDFVFEVCCTSKLSLPHLKVLGEAILFEG